MHGFHGKILRADLSEARLEEGFEDKVTTDEIIAYCRDKVPPYAVPKFVEFKSDLPLTATEKLFKKALREGEARKMQAKEGLKQMDISTLNGSPRPRVICIRPWDRVETC